MGFSRQEYWSGLLCPPPGIFLTQGSNPELLRLLHRQAGSLPLGPPGKPHLRGTLVFKNLRSQMRLPGSGLLFFLTSPKLRLGRGKLEGMYTEWWAGRGCRRYLAGQWQLWGLRKGPGCHPWSRVRGVSGAGDPILGRSSGWEGLARREAVGAGRGRSGRHGEQEPPGPVHHETWVRATFLHLFLTADSNLQMRQVRLVELHPAGQPRPEQPGHRPRARPWPQPKGQDISHAQR